MKQEIMRVVVTSPSFSRNSVLLGELEQLGIQVIPNSAGIKLEGELLAEFIKQSGAEVAIVGLETIDREILEQCKRLRYVAKYGVGLDNLDLLELNTRGIGVGWSGGINRRSVSELVLGFALGHCRNITQSVLRLKRNEWIKDGGSQLSNLTFGIVGLGSIGEDLAKLLKSFGTRVLYNDIADRTILAQKFALEPVTYDELLRVSDIVSFHVPSTALTHMMFGGKQILHCKRTALIINTARGNIIDFESVTDAVISGRLGGFASDVFPVEPCDLKKWSNYDRLYFTPHIGGNAHEAVLAMGRSAITHIKQYMKERGSN